MSALLLQVPGIGIVATVIVLAAILFLIRGTYRLQDQVSNTRE